VAIGRQQIAKTKKVMKFKLVIFALLTLLIASCTREILPEPEGQERELVTISATISPETRVSYTDGAPGTLAWESGDQLLLAGFDGTGNYISSSTFNWQSGNNFTGQAVQGAVNYKAYYAATFTLDGNGNVQPLADNFWEQTQTGNGSTAHLAAKLLLSDTQANPLSQTFELDSPCSIIKFALSNIPEEVGELSKLIWTVETASGPQSMTLNVNNVTIGTGATGLNAFLAFDPTTMQIAPNGETKIMLVGTKSCKWNATVASPKIYSAKYRYTAAVGNWVMMSQFRFNITIDQAGTTYEIWQPTAATINPAELTIDWGDGSPNTTIDSDATLSNVAIASHPYGSAGDYTITIYSDQPDPSNIQMPQITFSYNEEGDECLTAILDPFPNMGATDFTQCFYGCTQLDSIPAGLFSNNKLATCFEDCFCCTGLTEIPTGLFSSNTEATDFYGCFSGCTGLTSIPTGLFDNNTKATNFVDCFSQCPLLTSIPSGLFDNNTKAKDFSQCFSGCTGLTEVPAGLFVNNTEAINFYGCFRNCNNLKLIAEIFPDPATNANFFAGREMNFKECFQNVGTSSATPGTAPELWRFAGGGAGTTWTITDCFTGATTLTNYSAIPPGWKGL
jgi:hypothetical protein